MTGARNTNVNVKIGGLWKRSQNLSKLTTPNYKHRVFILTNHSLCYYKGTIDVSFTCAGRNVTVALLVNHVLHRWMYRVVTMDGCLSSSCIIWVYTTRIVLFHIFAAVPLVLSIYFSSMGTGYCGTR